jgi:hypothetical protein
LLVIREHGNGTYQEIFIGKKAHSGAKDDKGESRK